MSLEKNIERIADALEAIAGMKGGKTDITNITYTHPGQPQQAPQGMGQAPTPQNGGQAFQTPPAQQQGGQIPVSLPPDAGMQWQGAGSHTGAPVNYPQPQQQATQGIGQQQTPPLQQPGSSGPVPTTATVQNYTFDQLAVATANLAAAGKDVFTILGRFGVSMLMDLPQERYGEYAAALREAGAVI